jgi:WD40 repeat protein
LYCELVITHPFRNEIITLSSSQSPPTPHPTLNWNSIETGRQLGNVTWPKGAVRDVVVDPIDGSAIVAVDNSIEVYDRDRKKTQELKLAAHLLFRSLAVSADGKQLAIATDQQQSLVCRKTPQGNWVLCGDAPSERPGFIYDAGLPFPTFNSLGFDSTGDYLFSTHQFAMVVQAISSTGEPTEVARFSDLTIRQVRPLTTGLTAAWMSAGRCGLWRPSLPMSPIQGHRRETWSVAYSHSGKLLASGSDDLTAGLWDLKSGTRLAELKGHTATITAVEFSPDDSLLVTGSLDGAVKVWDVRTHQQLKTLQISPTEVRALAWFSDGKRLATVDCPRNSLTNSILVWDVPSGKVLKTFHGFTDRVQSVQVTPDQQSVVGVSDDMSIRVFRLNDKSNTDIPWCSWSTDEPIRCGVLMDRGRKVATGDNNGMIRLWAVDTGVELNVLKGHTKCVLCLRLSPDGKVLASGGLDKVIHLWDVETGLRLLTFKDLPAQVNGLAFSPAGDVLTAALHDGSIKHFYAPRIKPIQFESR